MLTWSQQQQHQAKAITTNNNQPQQQLILFIVPVAVMGPQTRKTKRQQHQQHQSTNTRSTVTTDRTKIGPRWQTTTMTFQTRLLDKDITLVLDQQQKGTVDLICLYTRRALRFSDDLGKAYLELQEMPRRGWPQAQRR